MGAEVDGGKKQRKRRQSFAHHPTETIPVPWETVKDFYNKLNDGDFKTKLPYPDKPTKKLVQKPVIREFEPLTYEYDPVEWEAYQQSLEAYNVDKQKLQDDFEREMMLYHGIDKEYLDHPFVRLLYNEAWEDGHSYGFSEVSNIFGNKMALYQEFKKVDEEVKRLAAAIKVLEDKENLSYYGGGR